MSPPATQIIRSQETVQVTMQLIKHSPIREVNQLIRQVMHQLNSLVISSRIHQQDSRLHQQDSRLHQQDNRLHQQVSRLHQSNRALHQRRLSSHPNRIHPNRIRPNSLHHRHRPARMHLRHHPARMHLLINSHQVRHQQSATHHSHFTLHQMTRIRMMVHQILGSLSQNKMVQKMRSRNKVARLVNNQNSQQMVQLNQLSHVKYSLRNSGKHQSWLMILIMINSLKFIEEIITT